MWYSSPSCAAYCTELARAPWCVWGACHARGGGPSGSSGMPAVAGARAAKAADGESRKRGREDKTTIKLTLAYYGPAFSGYAYQPSPDEPTVQRSVQDAIWSAAAR